MASVPPAMARMGASIRSTEMAAAAARTPSFKPASNAALTVSAVSGLLLHALLAPDGAVR